MSSYTQPIRCSLRILTGNRLSKMKCTYFLAMLFIRATPFMQSSQQGWCSGNCVAQTCPIASMNSTQVVKPVGCPYKHVLAWYDLSNCNSQARCCSWSSFRGAGGSLGKRTATAYRLAPRLFRRRGSAHTLGCSFLPISTTRQSFPRIS